MGLKKYFTPKLKMHEPTFKKLRPTTTATINVDMDEMRHPCN